MKCLNVSITKLPEQFSASTLSTNSQILSFSRDYLSISVLDTNYLFSTEIIKYILKSSGNLLTQLIGVPLSTPELWPFMFAVPLGVALVSLVVFILMHESPHYALMFSHNRREVCCLILIGYFLT